MRRITWLLVLCSSAFLIAQQPKTFRTRLAPVPIDVSMQATIAGSGTASAVLTGTKLAVTYHPAFLLRDPRQKKEAWKDLQMVMRELGLQAPAQKR